MTSCQATIHLLNIKLFKYLIFIFFHALAIGLQDLFLQITLSIF